MRSWSDDMPRADHVGSLLRPPALQAARAARDDDDIDADALHAAEDDAIANAVRLQKDIGLASITDGEFRRGYWHYDFLAGLRGIALERIKQDGPLTAGFVHRHRIKVHGPIGWQPHPFVDDFLKLAASAGPRARQTIPSPSVVHFRLGQQALQSGAYIDLDTLLADLADAYGKAVKAFADAGCRYLQLDEVNLAMLCDPAQIAEAGKRGVWRDDLATVYAELINTIIRDRPPGMRIGMHLCRGNFRSTWIAQGGYEPIADLLFNNIDIDTYFMEYDTERAGDFSPLRFLPKGHKVVVLGIVSSKTGEIEDKGTVKRRIEEAARYAPLNQLALSPQCGFASTEEGNDLNEAQQWEKLRLCVSTAREIWP